MGDASPSPTTDMKSPQFDRSPAISSSDTLEEGEITEASCIASTPPHPQQKDQLPLKLSNTGVLPRHSTPSLAAEVTNRTSTPTTLLLAPTSKDMTAENLDRAKSLVLDLLGWGVTPEYLVECGVSAGALYRIFTDLRLRLPANLVSP
ncbi:hypothetical protein PAXRUDRAFT_835319 [Paxillus rubicundulus Ve08.2h10]|uniref:Uncharacterized protein n=1 Tax=Paxillus rubicundulus Ve08.2h10 TaxID=930991 RepID=A0A0D0D871_9AGAM|nr:hypothetical protein PAXRUDRAFT_835319 [Paxillus rubicundulus Ve08.2h10]